MLDTNREYPDWLFRCELKPFYHSLIRGLYQAINNEFIRHEFSNVEFINREEDMGLPGLRQAKESYNPDHFAEKYDAVYANEADNATGGK